MINFVLYRYYNVLPYDHSRVRLKYLDREIYINANYVRVPEANRKYILTQGKLQIAINKTNQKKFFFAILKVTDEKSRIPEPDPYHPDP